MKCKCGATDWQTVETLTYCGQCGAPIPAPRFRWMKCTNCDAVEYVECEADGWECPYCATPNESPSRPADGELIGDGTWCCWNCHFYDATTCPGEIYEYRDTECERWIRCNS